MMYMSIGAVVPGRSRVVVEAWATVGSEYVDLGATEFHFEFRGLEEAIANYIGKENGGVTVTHLRFCIQGVDESDRTIIGQWVRGSGFSGT